MPIIREDLSPTCILAFDIILQAPLPLNTDNSLNSDRTSKIKSASTSDLIHTLVLSEALLHLKSDKNRMEHVMQLLLILFAPQFLSLALSL